MPYCTSDLFILESESRGHVGADSGFMKVHPLDSWKSFPHLFPCDFSLSNKYWRSAKLCVYESIRDSKLGPLAAVFHSGRRAARARLRSQFMEIWMFLQSQEGPMQPLAAIFEVPDHLVQFNQLN